MVSKYSFLSANCLRLRNNLLEMLVRQSEHRLLNSVKEFPTIKCQFLSIYISNVLLDNVKCF